MASGSKVMCRKKVDTPWSIYRDFTVYSYKKKCEIKVVKTYPEVLSFKNKVIFELN